MLPEVINCTVKLRRIPDRKVDCDDNDLDGQVDCTADVTASAVANPKTSVTHFTSTPINERHVHCTSMARYAAYSNGIVGMVLLCLILF